MIVGIDSGTTYTKFAWEDLDMQFQFRSTADTPLADIYDELQEARIHVARVIGTQPLEHPFEEIPRENDRIKEEIKVQALGASYLVGSKRNLLVVSLGTGVTYTRVLFGHTVQMPLGNSLGGGFLEGMRRVGDTMLWRRDLDWEEFDRLASQGNPDLLAGDFYPGRSAKDLALANFGTYRSGHQSICAGAVSVVSTTVAKDLVLYSLLTKDVVFVGTASRLTSLQDQLKSWQPLFKKRFHFPEDGAFAGALGAMLLQ